MLAFCLLNKQPPGEPFDDSGALKPQCSFSDVRHLLELCDETEDDTLLYRVFERIAGESTSKRVSDRLTRDHKAEISRRMVDIAERRLPMSGRIQHEGYRVLWSYCQIWCTEGWSCDGPAVLGDLDAVVELQALDHLAELTEAA